MESNCSKFSKRDFLFLGLFLIVFIIQIWKAHIGMGFQDEYFHIATGYRIAQGDAMFLDEWHITQIIAFFLAPLIKGYLALNGSMDGIVLCFRVLYSIFTMIIGFIVYLRFRHYGFAALPAALMCIIYTPFNLMELSYNTMGIGFLTLALLIFDDKRNSGIRIFFSGVFFACAVLNTPYLAILYVVLLVAVFFGKQLSSRNLGIFTLGIAVIAVIFLYSVFSRISISQFLSSLPHLVDEGHSDGVFMRLIKNMGKLVLAFRLWSAVFVVELAAVVCSVFSKKETRLFPICCLLNSAAAVTVIFMNMEQLDIGGFTLVLFPFFLTGFEYWILNYQKRDSYITLCFFVSAADALMIAASSNVGPRSFLCPLILACSMTVLMIWDDQSVYFGRGSIAVLLIILAYFKAANVYDGSGNYDCRFSDGPLAGLYDSRENLNEYADLLEDVDAVNRLPERNAMLITWNTWEYLALEKRIATNSTFINSAFEEEWFSNQDAYYLSHPERFPAYVYLDLTNAPFGLTGDEPELKGYRYVQDMKKGKLFIRD